MSSEHPNFDAIAQMTGASLEQVRGIWASMSQQQVFHTEIAEKGEHAALLSKVQAFIATIPVRATEETSAAKSTSNSQEGPVAASKDPAIPSNGETEDCCEQHRLDKEELAEVKALWSECQARIVSTSSCKENTVMLNDMIASLQEKRKQVSKDKHDLHRTVIALRGEIEGVDEHFTQRWETIIQEHQGEMRGLQAREENLTQEIVQLQAAVGNLEVRKLALQTDLHASQCRADELEEQNKNLRYELDASRSYEKAFKSEAEQLRQKVAEYEARLNDRAAMQHDVATIVKSSTNQVCDEVRQVGEQVTQVNDKADLLNSNVRAMRKEGADTHEDVLELQAQVTEMKLQPKPQKNSISTWLQRAAKGKKEDGSA